MITKNNLIDMLKRSMTNEDEFIMRYGESCFENLARANILNDDEKDEIKNLLNAILKDTERHSNTIKILIENVKGDSRNEF